MRDFTLLHTTLRLVASALAAGIVYAATAGLEGNLGAAPAGIIGPASVVDGDTIMVNLEAGVMVGTVSGSGCGPVRLTRGLSVARDAR